MKNNIGIIASDYVRFISGVEIVDMSLGNFTEDKSGVWTCTIVEDFEGGIINTISAWCDLIHSNFLGTRLPSILYRSQAEIIMGGNKGGGNVRGEKLASRTIYLHGVYPIAYKVGNIDPNSSAPVSITVDFNYDFFTDNPYNLTSGFGII